MRIGLIAGMIFAAGSAAASDCSDIEARFVSQIGHLPEILAQWPSMSETYKWNVVAGQFIALHVWEDVGGGEAVHRDLMLASAEMVNCFEPDPSDELIGLFIPAFEKNYPPEARTPEAINARTWN